MIQSEDALKAIRAAEKEAERLKITVTTVVVDDHGTIIASKKMDGALVISPKFAYTKAYTAATLKAPTSTLSAYSIPQKPYYGVTSLFGGKLCVIAGGVPVRSGNKIIGAVGVGGSADVSQDEVCAKAAVAVLDK